MRSWLIYGLATKVWADLPLHASYTEIVGDWQFDIVAEIETNPGVVLTCGSTLPNSIDNAIKLNKFKPHEYINSINDELDSSGSRNYRLLRLSSDRAVRLNATNSGSRSKWEYLTVYDQGGGPIGHWTMVFDEGFDILLDNGDTLTGLLKFDVSGDNCDVAHTIEHRDASTGCVRTLSNITLIGWFDEEGGNHGCFNAQKIGDRSAPKASRDCSQKTKLQLTEIDGVPQTYSDGDPILRPDKLQDWELEIPLQGKCGSCYGIATAYATVKRLLIKEPTLGVPDLQVMVEDITDCSLYNQGCAGGYPYFAHKWIQQYGGIWRNRRSKFGLRKTTHQLSLLDLDGRCARADLIRTLGSGLPLEYKLIDDNRILRVVDHGYVGGCFGCANEALIREEIFRHGPVIAAIDVPHELLSYRDGIIGKGGAPHNRVCDLDNVNGWEYTNHAVVLVGFGVEDDDDQTPFWIARNSWGYEWGRQGYFKIIRGLDFGGIENQVTYADPLVPEHFQDVLA